MNISHNLEKSQSANSQYSSETISEIESKCLSHMASKGVQFEGPLIQDEKIHRFSIDQSRDKAEWYIAFGGVSPKGNSYLNCVYGSFREGVKYTFNSWEKANYIDEQERKAIQQDWEQRKKEVETERKRVEEERQITIKSLWDTAQEQPLHPDQQAYLERKKIKGHGVKYGKDSNDNFSLIIPLRNINGEVQCIQFIRANSEKRFYGSKRGNFHVIGEIKDESLLFISEGYATGASIYEANGWPVVVAFDCGNLDPVIGEIRKKYPRNQIVIIADDDRETAGNPGKTKAIEAARKYGCEFIIPKFPDDFRLTNGKFPTDFNDLYVHFGLDQVKKQLSDIQKVTEDWDPPTQLPEGLPPVASLRANMIPEALRGWLLDIAERMQIPSDFSAAAAIVVLGSLIGRKLGIHPKEKDDWVVVPNLWGAIVGRPSLMKSPAISEVMKPLNQFVIAAKMKYDEEMGEQELKKIKLKAKKGVLEENLKKAVKNNVTEEELNNLIASCSKIDSCVAPIERRYKTEDGTIEKIGEILLQNPIGILIHRDELTGWFKSLDKDNREGDRAFFLESWNGNGGFTVDRIGRGTLHIPALCLSILGGIQPGPLSSYVYQATKGGVGDDGLLQRFQLTVWPDAPKEWVNIDRWPDTHAKNRAYEIFKKIDSYKPSFSIQDTDLDVPAVRFSPEAQQVFNLWREELEKQIRSGDLSPSMEAHIAKYRSLMPSLALIFQFCQDADCCREIKQVERSSAELAVCWCKYLETHAHRLYASAENPALESARALLQRLKKGSLVDGFTLRDVYRSDWSKLSSLEEAKNATDILVEYGWIRSDEKRTSTKSKKIFMIHPQLRR